MVMMFMKRQPLRWPPTPEIAAVVPHHLAYTNLQEIIELQGYPHLLAGAATALRLILPVQFLNWGRKSWLYPLYASSPRKFPDKMLRRLARRESSNLISRQSIISN